jgi:hypothetical protein
MLETLIETRFAMIGRFVLGGCVLALGVGAAHAQDVPGIEICTVEKTMERRTSCLQSNVEFLQKTIVKLTLDHQQKLDAANRQIEALKVNLTALQKTVSDLQAAQPKPGGGCEEDRYATRKRDNRERNTCQGNSRQGRGGKRGRQINS